MKKKELVEALSVASKESRAACERVLDALAAVAQGALRDGKSLNLPGIGKLKLKQLAARSIQTPRGVAMDVPARTAVKFRAAQALKDMLEDEA
jgi:DNA-binding protein HU-beta